MARMSDRYPQNYQEAERMLHGRPYRTLDGRDTSLDRISATEIAIRYHWTYVVTFQANGAIRLNSGNWLTVTTKDRINSALYDRHIGVYQQSFAWYVGSFGQDKGIAFRDHMAVWPDGTMTYHPDSAYVTLPDSQETAIPA